jgi:ketosteroid isomerase-like protein
MNRTDVMRWVAGYEDAWRSGDLAALAALFTEDARYRRSPYEPSAVGHRGIAEFWQDDVGSDFTLSAELVAVDGLTAVVRLEVHYAEPVRQEYRDLWVLRFAGDGRVADFEEWAYWPGLPYCAADAPPVPPAASVRAVPPLS